MQKWGYSKIYEGQNGAYPISIRGMPTNYTYQMFNHTDSFSDYIAASPSLWWGDGVIIPKNKPFLKSHPKSMTITFGELEKKLSTSPLDAIELIQTLSKDGFNAQFILFPGKTHRNSIPDALKITLEILENQRE
ncbi:hypothetical protein [Helicobacter sp. 13S00477-4]|uniref:hypothetical protein n=1 Tax=Helicobacter sp. 13S00477-4 TaxID=1905759 RepID=UPI000BA61801|nr:hypothetical protein [Helicobacter sp. 13S00477-4]PAF51961.1 hypothetical protein BKH44_04685 [Helicobacter sp. 13S00477-4]